MTAPLKESVQRMPTSLLIAGGALAMSVPLYVLFLLRVPFGRDDGVARLAAWHLPLAVLAVLTSLYAAARRRSNGGLVILVLSVAAVLVYVNFSVS